MNTTQPDPSAVAKLRDLIKGIHFAMLTTVAPDGSLHSRPMGTQDTDFDGDLWFFTADDSGKADEIAHEHHVNISYAEPKDQRYVSISGTATLTRDREKARQLWKPFLKTWFPQELDDPHLALLRVNVERAEYWDAPSNRMVHLFGRAKEALTGHSPKNLKEHEKLEVRRGM